MRIVHIMTRFMRGGAEENVLLSCNGQASRGHAVDLIVGRATRPEMLAQLDERVRVHRIPSMRRSIHPFADSVALWRLIQLLRDLRPDVVHTHTSKAGVLGRIAARLAGVGVIVHGVHILPSLGNGWLLDNFYSALERAVVPVTDAYIDVSDAMRTACLARGIGNPARHVVVSSGMDLERFRAAAHRSRFARPKALEMLPDAEVLLMVAALEPRKRPVEFVDVFHRVAQTRPRAVLVIAGEGPEHAAIKARARHFGLADRVLLPGFVGDLDAWLAHADVCVLASRREGLARSHIQYALACRPVVATRLPGSEAVTIHGQTGFLVDPDRLDEMAEPIVTLLADRNLAERFSAAARQLDLSGWSTEAMVEKLELVYATLLERSLVAEPELSS